MSEGTRISFHFHPNDAQGAWCVEKEEDGKKRRYLEGISSGLQLDGAGERMTAKAIGSFHKQAQSGDVLLYAGKHGVDFTDDIGKLVFSEIQPSGDWMTRYRLYDEMDGLGGSTLEKCDKVWRQVNGLPPYSKPKQKGFSVEGVIPEGGIAQLDQSGKRTMDAVDLDGVLLVSRPAYKDGVARAVFKALGVVPPSDMKEGLHGGLGVSLGDVLQREDYYQRYYSLQGALDEQVHHVMKAEGSERADQLRTLFAEYGDLMVDLIVRSESVFKDDTPTGGSVRKDRTYSSRQALLTRLKVAGTLLEKCLVQRGHTVGA